MPERSARLNRAEGTPVVWTMEGPPGAETTVNGRQFLYFAGTGYLGLQSHPALVAAAREALDRYGIHTATSRAGFGTCPPVRDVERRAAELLQADDAIYLVSGYAANTAVAAALAGSIDEVLIDQHAHESLQESVRALGALAAPPTAFRHCDARHLNELLRRAADSRRRTLVMTDGLFAASGDLAPLAEYLEVLRRVPNTALLVDDAHGIGVLGAGGRGALEHAGLALAKVNRDIDEQTDGPRIYHTATLSKAIGGYGGIVAGSTAFIEQVRRSSGWYRGASAPPAAMAAASAKGLELVMASSVFREALLRNMFQLRQALMALGLPVEESPSPIIGLRLPSAAAMQHVHQRLESEGILIGYTRDYAGAGPDGMLRIAVFATHTPEMLERLVVALKAAL